MVAAWAKSGPRTRPIAVNWLLLSKALSPCQEPEGAGATFPILEENFVIPNMPGENRERGQGRGDGDGPARAALGEGDTSLCISTAQHRLL